LKVNILGTDYEIRKLSESEYPKLKISEANGLAELYSKELIIDSEMNGNTGKEYANFKGFEDKVIRHEIVHAFFHESGLVDYCADEELVNWLALQLPKIMKAFKDADCA
jgi:hypothetical protein